MSVRHSSLAQSDC